jgi:hypothetical protein
MDLIYKRVKLLSSFIKFFIFVCLLADIVCLNNNLSKLSYGLKKQRKRNFQPYSMNINYPVTIKNVLSKMTQLTQNALRDRKSRMIVELPPVKQFTNYVNNIE